jgi:hypothetical protein
MCIVTVCLVKPDALPSSFCDLVQCFPKCGTQKNFKDYEAEKVTTNCLLVGIKQRN